MTRQVHLNNLTLGNGKIYIQSMLNAKTIEDNIAQAIALEKAGCDIIRIAIPNEESVSFIAPIKAAVSMPLVADIHFDYRLALHSIEASIDKIRINPGNIGSEDKVKLVVDACKNKGIPIRVGVNAGSLERDVLAKYGGKPCAAALVESALYHISLLEKYGFYDTVISMKSSNVKMTIDAYRMIKQRVNYPLHIGVTEAGTKYLGELKNAIGIGSLLLDGIGDTIRVSLTADPVDEVYSAKAILQACGIRKQCVNIISCPTCMRTNIDIIGIANRLQDELADIKKDITVAVMGCVVNGPGEAKEADIGIAGGDACAVLFKKGKVIRKVAECDIITAIKAEIDTM